mgnify:CR=1 FL=1
MIYSKEELVKEALNVRQRAYAPYSKFQVGAAVMTESGKIITGCNIENASFGLSVCAERVAIFKAISEKEKIQAIAVASNSDYITLPCGACRQVIQELCPQAELFLADSHGNFEVYKIDDLLPQPFKLNSQM